jgi:Phosphotransferase enzyme family
MTGSPAAPMLSAAEQQAAGALLAAAGGERAEVRAAEPLWDRSHVFRLRAGPGRPAVLKRRGDGDGGRRGSGAELAALEYLNAMPEPVAPRLLGSDPRAGLLLMEDLGPGASLADSLLAGDRAQAGSDRTWSPARGRSGPSTPGARGAPAAGGVTQEMDGLTAMLEGTGYVGLVHGDACPDNVRLLPGGARIFDFETSGWGPVALDASYLLAPFPSCWCFASPPAEAAAPAVAAYRAAVEAAGVRLGPDWDAATAAALIGWVIARGRVISRALDEDRDWGTTSMRPRLLTWLRSCTETAGRTGALPRLRALADGMYEQLSARWYQTVIPEYPALARPGAAPVQVPGWWPPEAGRS